MTTTSKLTCQPRYGTPRTPDRPTLGHAVAEVARRLGKPLMPWQRHVADIALEVDPDTGRLAYNEVGLTVPRQSGKSTLILAKAVHRATATGFFGERQKLVYTAQTRNKAREKWEEDYAADLKASRTFGPRIKPHFGNGNEHIRFPNGSRFGIESTTEKAGHGSTLDEAYIDEAFAQIDHRLEQAFSPAMITRPNTQLWWVSTAGWLDGSPYLIDKVQRGRDQADMGIRDGLAYFEWSAPDDADPEDRDVWRECMPALGLIRADGSGITEETIAGELRKMADRINDFRRAYMNQWVLKDAPEAETIIDLADWEHLANLEAVRPTPVAFSVEVSADRKWSSIGLAGRRTDGRRHLQIVQAGRGTGWVPARVAELEAEWKPTGVLVNASGPAGSLLAPLEAAGVSVTKVTTSEYMQSCAMFADGVAEHTIHHAGQAQVNTAIGAARRKRSTGGAYQFVPSDPSIDIAPLRALTLALYGLERSRKTKRSGKVW